MRAVKRGTNPKTEQVGAWLKEQYPTIHAEVKAENAEIFWEGDETLTQIRSTMHGGTLRKGSPLW